MLNAHNIPNNARLYNENVQYTTHTPVAAYCDLKITQ